MLLCRKLLMNIAVVGAPTNQSFMQYVECLAANNYVPPNGKSWVDHGKTRNPNYGADASDLISFAEMVLKFIFEFPNRVPAPK